MTLESELSQQCAQQGSSLTSDAPLTGNTRSAETGATRTDRPPHPCYIPKGHEREDGFRFSGWAWRYGKWEKAYLSPAVYEKGRLRSLEHSRKRRKEKPEDTRKRNRECRKVLNQKNPGPFMLSAAKSRSKRNGIPFNLSIDDIIIPEVCPVLGVPLRVNTNGKNFSNYSPSLDRIVPSLGYTKGNVIVISMLANRIKSNATPDQILAVGSFFKNLMTTRSPT